MRNAIFAAIVLCLHGAVAGADWLTAPSYYTHDWSTGERVSQYCQIGPYYYLCRPDYLKSGYRQYRSTIDLGNSSDNMHIVEQWGAPVRPYEEWQYPFRPFSVPYGAWGPPYGGLGGGGGLYPYGGLALAVSVAASIRRQPTSRSPGSMATIRNTTLTTGASTGGPIRLPLLLSVRALARDQRLAQVQVQVQVPDLDPVRRRWDPDTPGRPVRRPVVLTIPQQFI